MIQGNYNRGLNKGGVKKCSEVQSCVVVTQCFSGFGGTMRSNLGVARVIGVALSSWLTIVKSVTQYSESLQ